MKKATFDPGLTQKVTGTLRRSINKDGSFNVYRRGGSWRHFHPYLYLLNMTWLQFLGLVLAGFLVLNLIFAVIYFWLGPEALRGAEAPSDAGRFLNDFFFSSHTITTVGYGNISPNTVSANIVSSLEALLGLLATALGTGLLFGRFSRPSAKIAFSEHMLVAPFEEVTSLQFRIANLRPNVLMDLKADVILMTVEGPLEDQKRKYQPLRLERDSVYFLALTWTIVHPIEETSPLYGKTPQDLADTQAELLIIVRGFDDTFSQTVNARYSYRYDELHWSAKFEPAFAFDAAGNMVLNVDRVGSHSSIQPTPNRL